ncbi:hypothetical protein FGIG_07450 [Fasciola gigantica]|uniref:Uncharacterized protein n=1 Tax=Fasciola gigantica TaxID=46835 RepID=A0A504ZEA5_FASGI|nr:hypothetical protein FGIG_07450 [Fasciola gigantica]
MECNEDKNPPDLSEHSQSELQISVDRMEFNQSETPLELVRLQILELGKRIGPERLQCKRGELEGLHGDCKYDITSADASNHNDRPLETSKCCLDLPKRNISEFDGNPKLYYSFLKKFHSVFEKRTTDSSTQLMCLIQYCDGKAKEAIQHFTVLEAGEGLKAATEKY